MASNVNFTNDKLVSVEMMSKKITSNMMSINKMTSNTAVSVNDMMKVMKTE